MLLVSGDFSEKLAGEIATSSESIVICSAFMKEDALLNLLDNAPHGNITLISRWRMGDIITGASDLEVYNACKHRGWEFGIDPLLHGKIYLVDKEKIFIGSANLTASGLSMKEASNNEFGTFINPTKLDLEKVKIYLEENVVWVTDDLFKKLKNEIDSFQDNLKDIERVTWSNEIVQLLEKPIEFIWVNELLFCIPSQLLQNAECREDDKVHDLITLSIESNKLEIEDLKMAFRKTKIYKWLISILREQDSINFGGFSSMLHNALIDDPTPYRKNVKWFVSILFEWMALDEDVFEIRKHNVTSSVSLVSTHERY